MKHYDFSGEEYPPLSDVLAAHLKGCVACQESLKAPPVPNVVMAHMTRPKLCGEWYEIIRDYAQYEGQVNNIVAHTESGTEAYHQRDLWDEGNDAER